MRFFAIACCTLSFSTLLPIKLHAKMAFMHEHLETKRILVSNNDGLRSRAITPKNKISLYPDLSSDGRQITYVQGTTTDSLEVVIHNLITGKIKSVFAPEKGRTLHPDFSADGRAIAFSSNHGNLNNYAIYLYSVDQKTNTTLRTTIDIEGASLFFPTLNSDASFIIYQKDNLETKQRIIVRRNLGDNKEVEISDSRLLSMSPSLSFDDRYVAYTAKKEDNWDIYMSDLIDGTSTRITSSPNQDFAPTFTIEGDLLFATDSTGRFELYRLSRKNFNFPEKAVKLTNLEGDVYAPSISGMTNYHQKTKAPVLSPARSSFGAAIADDRIYIVGGHQGSEHTYPPESFLNNLEALDLKTNRWTRSAPRPHASHGFEVATYMNKLFAFGGFAYSADHKPRWKSLDLIEKYDPDSNTWQEIGQMPRKRSSYVLGQVGTKIYFFGGWDSTPKHEGDYDGVFHRKIDVFDLETETSSVLSVELPNPLRRAFTSVVKGNKIYLIGGLGQGASHFELLSNVTVFDTTNESFKELRKLPFATFAPAAGFVGDDLHVFGGMFKTSPEDYIYVNHIYKLSNDTEEWINTGRFLRESKGFARVVNVSNDEVYIIGGHHYELDGTDAPIATVETFSAK